MISNLIPDPSQYECDSSQNFPLHKREVKGYTANEFYSFLSKMVKKLYKPNSLSQNLLTLNHLSRISRYFLSTRGKLRDKSSQTQDDFRN